MKNYLILITFVSLIFTSCNSNDSFGKIKEIGLEMNYVLFPNTEDTTIIKTTENGWSIGGIYISDHSGELKLYPNNSYIKEYEDGSRINQHCDTMTYEWIELVKISPNELKIVVQENSSDMERTLKILLHGLVGYFGEDLTIVQQGKE